MKVLIDNGHGCNTRGKCSPDKRLLEWSYTRKVADLVVSGLKAAGIDAQLLVPERYDVPLTTRCARANSYCYKMGKNNVLVVSIHVNAAGADGQWHDAGGWSAYTSKGETKSDKVAECLYDAATMHLQDYCLRFAEGKAAGDYGKKQKPIRTDKTDGDRDCEANFTILYNTLCPAVLTENMFQDNRADVDWLLKGGADVLAKIHIDGIKNYLATL